MSGSRALRAFGEKFAATPEASRGVLVVPEDLLVRPSEELRCPICMDFPLSPWVLSCDHSFCQGCLDAHWSNSGVAGRLKCPVCRDETMESMKLSRPLRSIVQSSGFRCFDASCCWEGHSYESAKSHWIGCGLVKRGDADANRSAPRSII